MSSYFEFKCNSALNKEGNSNKFACWPNKGVQRELGLANSGSLGTANSLGVSATTYRSTSSDISPPQLQMSLEQQDLVSTEIQTMVEKQAITVVQPDQRGFVSQIFLVPKKDGGHRPIANLKALNKFIVEELFKMEGFHMVKDLVKSGDWLAKIAKEKVAQIRQEAKQLYSKVGSVSTEASNLCGHDDSGKTGYPGGSTVSSALASSHKQSGAISILYRGSETELSSVGQNVSGGHTGVEVVDARNTGAPLLMDPPDLVIESDASRLGWGATLKDQKLKTGGQWSTSEQEMHINCLELLAASLVIQTFAKEKKIINILVRTDNVSARAYINHFGGTHSWPMNCLAVQIWKWCIECQIFLTAEHLPGVMNQGQCGIAATRCFTLNCSHRSRGKWVP